jgi:hypothetical protein
MKQIIVECCNDCPFSFEGDLGTIADTRCSKSKTGTAKVERLKLPDWCPLEDLIPKNFDNENRTI